MATNNNSIRLVQLTKDKTEHGRLEARLRITAEQISELRKKAKKHFNDDPKKVKLYESDYQESRWFSKKPSLKDIELDATYSYSEEGISVHTSMGYMNSRVKGRELYIELEGEKSFAEDFYAYLDSII